MLWFVAFMDHRVLVKHVDDELDGNVQGGCFCRSRTTSADLGRGEEAPQEKRTPTLSREKKKVASINAERRRASMKVK